MFKYWRVPLNRTSKIHGFQEPLEPVLKTPLLSLSEDDSSSKFVPDSNSWILRLTKFQLIDLNLGWKKSFTYMKPSTSTTLPVTNASFLNSTVVTKPTHCLIRQDNVLYLKNCSFDDDMVKLKIRKKKFWMYKFSSMIYGLCENSWLQF